MVAPVRPPVESFFANAPFKSPLLSPNGKLLAIVVGSPGKRNGLAVIDLADNHVYSTVLFPDTDTALHVLCGVSFRAPAGYATFLAFYNRGIAGVRNNENAELALSYTIPF